MRELKDAVKRIDRAKALVIAGLAKRDCAVIETPIRPGPPPEWAKVLANLAETRASLVALRAEVQRDAARCQKKARP